MKMPLDFSTPRESYKVHAYDKRADIALVELDSDYSEKPFRVLLGFGYDTDYDWASSFQCYSIADAFRLYDEIMRNTLVDNGAPRAEGTI